MRLAVSLCAVVLSVQGASGEDWWDAGWQYRQRVFINASVLEEDLTDFPLRVCLTGAESPATLAQADGRDLRVVGAEGTLLPKEIVRWSQEVVEIHVKMPHIAAQTGGHYLDLYYGNPEATAEESGANTSAIWDASYRVVLHLNSNLSDATGKAEVATIEGDVRVGDGAAFRDRPGFLRIGPSALEGLGEQLTISVRFRVDGRAVLQTLASGMRTEPRDWFNFGIKLPNIVHTNASSAGSQNPELNPEGIAVGQWHAAVVRYDARNHTRTICIDGNVFQSDSGLPGPLRVQEVRIGRGLLHFDPWQFEGVIDEVRISDVARSDAWMRAEAASLGNDNRVYVVGVPQRYGEKAPIPGPVHLLMPAANSSWRKRGDIPLEWTPSAGARRYEVGIEDGEHNSRRFDAGAATQFKVPRALLRGNRMLWYVVVSNESGSRLSEEGPWCVYLYDWSDSMGNLPQEDETKPVLQRAKGLQIDLQGFLRKRIDKVIENWFLVVPESSPAILQVLRDRDKTPVRDPLVPWAGEFAGKFLTAAQLNWRLTHDERLKGMIDQFVRDLIACQAENGYLGPFPESSRLTGGNWDVWGHYHCMLGLLLYYEDTGFEPALTACKRAADLLFETFGPGGPSLTNDGAGGQMNMAASHGLLLLYKKTGVPRYLELAKYIVEQAWNEPSAGHYLESALARKDMVEFPQHRWEALHDFQAMPELFWLTSDEKYRKAFEHIWWATIRGDRHNTGGFSSGEGYTGSPYNPGAIETCCTVAWLAVSLDMLRLTGDSRIADEIEWSTFNSALGAIPYSGRACAYNVPMDGTRTFGVELPWQAPKGGPDLNCCSVNAPRALGFISQWALMAAADGLALNYYGPCAMQATLSSGNRVTITQETTYPADGHVRITVSPKQAEGFTLHLRIPRWSKETTVTVNGGALEKPTMGTYLPVNRAWQSGDVVEITLDFRPHFWAGEQECAGKISVYRGPILFAFDGRYSDANPDSLPAIDWKSLWVENVERSGNIEPWIPATLKFADGTALPVVDFASVGQTGNHYRSWLPANDLPPSPFHLTAPANGETGGVATGAGMVFRWDKRAGAESWTLRIARAEAPGDPVKRVEGLSAPEASVQLDAGEYVWSVEAVNADGTTEAANGSWRVVVK